MESIDSILLLAVAAFGAGVLNAIAGGGSFLTFPALVFTGVPPIVANATSALAVSPGYLGSTWGFKAELRELSATRLRREMLIAAVGGVLGALLLLLTPGKLFAGIVPWLLLFATLLFAAGPVLARCAQASATGHSLAACRTWGVESENRPQGGQFLPDLQAHSRAMGQKAGEKWTAAVDLQPTTPKADRLLVRWREPGLFLVSIYGGYFNGGLGILLMALYTVTGEQRLNTVNALKNLNSLVLSWLSVAAFVLGGAIAWRQGLLMMAAATVGGYLGARLAKKLPATWVRGGVIGIGLLMSVVFFMRTRG